MGPKLKAILSSSILRKQMVALTGLLLCGFLVVHLAGNLLLFVGPEAFNLYAHRLTSTPLIYAAEALLGLIFLVHLGLTLKLTLENARARGPLRYHTKRPTGRGATWASSTMPYTGAIILVFIVLHLEALKFGPVYYQNYGGTEVRDLFKTCLEYFAHPQTVAGYILAMVAISFHTYHGFWSAFQSLGVHHPKYTPLIRGLSRAFALLMGTGFSTLPVYCYFQARGLP